MNIHSAIYVYVDMEVGIYGYVAVNASVGVYVDVAIYVDMTLLLMCM